jgi:hypothetical protein
MRDDEKQNPEARSHEPEENKRKTKSGSPPFILDSGF